MSARIVAHPGLYQRGDKCVLWATVRDAVHGRWSPLRGVAKDLGQRDCRNGWRRLGRGKNHSPGRGPGWAAVSTKFKPRRGEPHFIRRCPTGWDVAHRGPGYIPPELKQLGKGGRSGSHRRVRPGLISFAARIRHKHLQNHFQRHRPAQFDDSTHSRCWACLSTACGLLARGWPLIVQASSTTIHEQHNRHALQSHGLTLAPSSPCFLQVLEQPPQSDQSGRYLFG